MITQIILIAMLHLTLRALGVLLGLFLISIVIFFKEDEEKKLVNMIEEWWNILETNSTYATSFHAKFFINSINSSLSIIDKLFGDTFFSWKFITNSFNLSVSSFFVCLFVLFRNASSAKIVFLSVALLFALAVIFSNGNYFIKTINAFLFVGTIGCLTWLVASIPTGEFNIAKANISFEYKPITLEYFIYALKLIILFFLINACLDFLILKSIQTSLIYIAHGKSLSHIITGLFVCSVIVILIFGIPIVGGFYYLNEIKITGTRFYFSFSLYYFMPCYSLVTSIFSLSPLVLVWLSAIVFFLHNLLWTAITRPIYALHRFGIFNYRKSIFTVGLSIVFVSITGNLSTFIQVVLKWAGVKI